MNAHMAQGAFLIFRVQHVMRGGLHNYARILAPKRARAVVAFEANRKDNRPLQQLGVRGPMRHVACGAAFDAHAGVFVDERPAFIYMALQAGLFVVVRGRH